MTEGSGLYLAGPALVKSAIGQDVGQRRAGRGRRCTRPVSGTIDFRDPDDDACLDRLRRLAESLPPDPRAGRQFRRSHGRARPAGRATSIDDRLRRARRRIRSSRPARLPRRCRQLRRIQGRIRPDGGLRLRPGWADLPSASSPTSIIACRRRRRAVAIWRRDLSSTARTRRPASSWTATRLGCRSSFLQDVNGLHGGPRFGAVRHHPGRGQSW